VRPFLAHHHTAGPKDYVDNGVAVFGYDHAFGIIEVPALEVVPHQRRIEVYGTEGAVIIPHLGSGHLPNKNVQPVEVYRKGKPAWERLDLEAAALQIQDLREFAACVSGKKDPDFSFEHDLTVQESLLEACSMVRR
jgi:predicted dehydrogenase